MASSYNLIDTKTGIVLKNYKSRDKATDAADRKDHAYGAVRYSVQPVWAD